MSETQNAELLELVRSLANRVDELEVKIKSLKLLADVDVPEETMVAIAAAVAGYLGYRARHRAASFTSNPTWQAATRRSQLNHAPLYLR